MLESLRNFMSKRTIASKARNNAMNKFSSYEGLKRVRQEAEELRQNENRPHEVIYFHKVDDPYSHLTIHCIDKLKSSYDISFKPILVGDENPKTVHEPSHYSKYCLKDVKRIAPFYGIEFPNASYPSPELVNKANSIIASVDDNKFSEIAKVVSFALWQGEEGALNDLKDKYNSTTDQTKNCIKQGNKIRDEKGYYFGSAFYYEKELYWGIDRLNYLEERLSDLNLKKSSNNESIYSLNLNAPNKLNSEKKINLTFYPSLNSPYTFISSKRVRELRDNYPINLITRPVLPMLMRNYSIPTFKAKYIISDAAREGRKHSHEINRIYSPIGTPARRAFSIFPSIDEKGKGFEYIEDLLKASFQDGINIGNKDYLEGLVNRLDLDWTLIKKDLSTRKWKKVLNDNVVDMFLGDCWGVPSFKITNEDGSDPFYVWGQDRLWLIKEEIAKRLT